MNRKHVLSILKSDDYEREIDLINYRLLTYFIPLIENQDDYVSIVNISSFEIPEDVELVIIKGEDIDGKFYFNTKLVNNGEKGIWKTPLRKGFYNLDTSNCKLIRMPTNFFILEWHDYEKPNRYDSSLTTLNIKTKDLYNIDMHLTISFRVINSPKFIKSTNLILLGISDEINQSKFAVLSRFTNSLLGPMIQSIFMNVFSEINCYQLIIQKQKYIEIVENNIKELFNNYGLQLFTLSVSYVKVPEVFDKKLNSKE